MNAPTLERGTACSCGRDGSGRWIRPSLRASNPAIATATAIGRRALGISRPEAETGSAPGLRGLLGTLGSGRSRLVLGRAYTRNASDAGLRRRTVDYTITTILAAPSGTMPRGSQGRRAATTDLQPKPAVWKLRQHFCGFRQMTQGNRKTCA